MSEELEVLRIVTGRLDEDGIPYMVTGSMAVNSYAVPRMTRDIDVVVELSVADLDRICELFRDEFYVEPEAVRESIERRTSFNILHHALVVKVDVVVRKDTEYRRAEFARRRRVAWEDPSASPAVLRRALFTRLSAHEIDATARVSGSSPASPIHRRRASGAGGGRPRAHRSDRVVRGVRVDGGAHRAGDERARPGGRIRGFTSLGREPLRASRARSRPDAAAPRTPRRACSVPDEHCDRPRPPPATSLDPSTPECRAASPRHRDEP